MEAESLESVELIRLAHLWAILNPHVSAYNDSRCRIDVAPERPYFWIDPVLKALGVCTNTHEGIASPEWRVVYRWMYGHD